MRAQQPRESLEIRLLNGILSWRGATVLVFVVICVIAFTIFTREPRSTAVTVPAAPGMIERSRVGAAAQDSVGWERLVDREYGVVCYADLSHQAISCVALTR